MSASHLLLGWLATAAIHASVLLALAWADDTLLRPRSLALRETLWRLALVGGLVTASLPQLAGTEPVGGRVALPLAAGVAVAAAPSTAPSPVAPAAAMSRNAALPGAVVRASATPVATDGSGRKPKGLRSGFSARGLGNIACTHQLQRISLKKRGGFADDLFGGIFKNEVARVCNTSDRCVWEASEESVQEFLRREAPVLHSPDQLDRVTAEGRQRFIDFRERPVTAV